MGWQALATEWWARRAGRRHVESDLARSARDIVGPLGMMLSKGWDAMATGSSAYVESLDRRLPPSLFVSERDRRRRNLPIPLVERCIEDWSPDTLASTSGPTDRRQPRS